MDVNRATGKASVGRLRRHSYRYWKSADGLLALAALQVQGGEGISRIADAAFASNRKAKPTIFGIGLSTTPVDGNG
jgi:hypothetical protein